MKIQSAKQRGKLLENWVADQIIAKGLDNRARRDGASGAGNREKADISTSLTINGINAGFECKNHKTLHIPDWWKQTKKLKTLNKEPILVYKLPREPFEETLCTLRLNTLLELCKNQVDIQDIVAENKYDNFKTKNIINNLKYWLDQFKKEL